MHLLDRLSLHLCTSLHPREMVEAMAQFLGREVSSCLPGLYILPKFQRQTRLVLDWLQVLAAGL